MWAERYGLLRPAGYWKSEINKVIHLVTDTAARVVIQSESDYSVTISMLSQLIELVALHIMFWAPNSLVEGMRSPLSTATTTTTNISAVKTSPL